VKHLNCKLYYQQLHLRYLCNLARYCLQVPWRWHDSVETCNSVVIFEIIVHLLVIVQNNKRYTVQRIKITVPTVAFCINLRLSALERPFGAFCTLWLNRTPKSSSWRHKVRHNLCDNTKIFNWKCLKDLSERLEYTKDLDVTHYNAD